ncbi:hypothetical protein E3N88_12387 [Mikania micrantha]|uniref:Uncharacterized protein n=1 Tax=Mikania micrantha TaxID=192012 RepID=A0A5N6P6N7_9ASTR|nr:hypothetical protein E3N88_12387 [Mikania micrantha]
MKSTRKFNMKSRGDDETIGDVDDVITNNFTRGEEFNSFTLHIVDYSVIRDFRVNLKSKGHISKIEFRITKADYDEMPTVGMILNNVFNFARIQREKLGPSKLGGKTLKRRYQHLTSGIHC